MGKTNCQQLLNIDVISSAFKDGEKAVSEQITACFYSCYQSLFLQWAKTTYHHYSTDTLEFAANSSFTDGVIKLTESARRGELYKGHASVQTILLSFCKNVLRGHLTSEDRLARKNEKLQRHLSSDQYETIDEESENVEKKYAILILAMNKMSAEDRQIIQWRHIEGRSNDEIARNLAIKIESATNRIYRCMRKLHEFVSEIEKNHKQ